MLNCFVTVQAKHREKLTEVPLLLHDNVGLGLSAHRSCWTKPRNLNVELKKCAIHHILLTRHQMITICIEI